MDAYQFLAEKNGCGGSATYRKVLEMLMTPRQAQVAAQLPAPLKDVATKLDIGLDQVKEEIRELFRKGVVFPKNFETMEGARFPTNPAQLLDFSLGSYLVQDIFGDRLFQVWGDFAQKEDSARLAKAFAKAEQPAARVLPAYKAIQGIPGVSQFDDVREILKAAILIATVPCSCRNLARKTDVILDSCLQFGRCAERAIVRGSGWKLSYKEALEIVDKAEDDGEVHMWDNVQTLTAVIMCNCEKEACRAWMPLRLYNVSVGKRAAKSRFEATVDQRLCDGCQVCVDRCQFDAIAMTKVPGCKRLKAMVDPEKCWGCGLCVIKCDPDAVTMKLVRPLEHIPLERPAHFEM